jgi:hypothetical protein
VDTPTLLLALFTVLVGDDPVRRLAIRSRGEGSWYGVIRPEGMDWRNDVHDVRPFIPAGTPVERVVVLPAVAEAPVEKRWDAGRLCLGGEDALSAEDALETAGHLLRRAACQRMIAAAFAARAAEPTPDPLAQARKDLLSRASMAEEEGDRYVKVKPSIIRALLAATEGTGGTS